MSSKFLLLLKVVFWVLCCNAQDAKNMNGKIIADQGSPADVLVLNLNTEKETRSDLDGNFMISAKIDDLIVFHSNSHEIVRKSIYNNDYLKGFFEVRLIPKPQQLDEIKIFNYSRINAVSLGILSEPAKTYTIAERRLYEATSGGGLMTWLNAINGRKKMLKKFVSFERIEARVSKLTDMFEPEFYTKTLEIPEDQVGRFLNFAAEDELVVKALSTKNKYLVSFELVKLAPQFKKLQNEN